MTRFGRLHTALPNRPRAVSAGRVVAARGPLIRAHLESAGVGDLCFIERDDGTSLQAQVVAFDETGSQLAPFDSIQGVYPGSKIIHTGSAPTFEFSDQQNEVVVIDCLGNILSSNSLQNNNVDSYIKKKLSFHRTPPSALSRQRIEQRMLTGIRAIDLCCPIGYGQRVGLFAGPGVGKSTLLGMIASGAEVDRVVIGLIGERGREVEEFINHALDENGRKRSIVVVATSDESPVRRKCAGLTATSIAEYYRDRGERVLLLFDSLTRAARSIRDLSLSAGELPVRQGYTSSVFEELPKLVERTGSAANGSITAIYTVLTSYDDTMDILSEEIKSLLDGHITLDRGLAEQGIFPAINLGSSVSRVIGDVLTKNNLILARSITRIFTRLYKDKPLALISGRPDPELKSYISIEKKLHEIFSQGNICCAEVLKSKSTVLLENSLKDIISSIAAAN